ncbi:MAG: TlpA family protein disulfide reductase [Acidimicrobiia bacterium]
MSPNPSDKPNRKAAAGYRSLRRHRLIVVATSVVVVAAIAGLFAFSSPEASDETPEAAAASVENPAPDVELVDFEGNSLRLSDLVGGPVVLNFWASWCPPCVAEMPDFEAVNQDIGDRVTFIGVNFQDDPDLAAALAVETGVSYLLVRDPQGLIFQEFDGLGMPTTVFIDATGSIREVITGQMSQDQLRAKIAEHFSVDV